MINTSNLTFGAGDKVVLADGPYRGTPGVFLRLGEDVNWAEIEERSSLIRRHPVVWLRRSDQNDRSNKENSEV